MTLKRQLPILFFSLSVLSLQLSCSSTETAPGTALREPQQAVDEVEDIEVKYEKSFMAAMTAEGDTENEKDHIRAAQVESYFSRQLSFFFIAQDLVQNFDQKLDRLYQKKIKNPKSEIDSKELWEDRVKLNIAWEFSDLNLHESQYVFARLLQESNTPNSPLKRAATESLHKMNSFFDKAWKNGDEIAALSVMQDLNDVFEDFLERAPKAVAPDFFKYLKTSEQERKVLYKKGLKALSKRAKTKIDQFLEKKWLDYQAKRMEERKMMSQDREPQTDNLYPDPGAPGNITGSHFAPGVWALTLDDGPHPTYTMAMIKTIQDAKMRATFFWLSQNLKVYPSLAKAAGEAGFRRGSHSYSHANLPKLGEAGLKHEIDEAGDVFAQIIGERPTFFRCPYGACGGNGSLIRQKIANQKMMSVLWNVDTLDWQDKNPQSIFERTKKQMDLNNHGIVLMHDIHPQSVEAMKLVVAYIKSKPNWHVYTMDEIYKLETGKDYHSP